MPTNKVSIRNSLIESGYFPERLPPPFTTANIAKFCQKRKISQMFAQDKGKYKPALYYASKRSGTRRLFSLVHPVPFFKVAEFFGSNWEELEKRWSSSEFSYSTPEYSEEAEKPFTIKNHKDLENEKFTRLSSYEYVAYTDISRFYYSIYTHSIEWAIYGKKKSKKAWFEGGPNLPLGRIDKLIQLGQDKQTMGIPVGPITSLLIAEIIGCKIDKKFSKLMDSKYSESNPIDWTLIRHVDDIWIGVNSERDAKTALSLFRVAVQKFELDINEAKTQIYRNGLPPIGSWAMEISQKLDFVSNLKGETRLEYLKSVLDFGFQEFIRIQDHSILKFILRKIDIARLLKDCWQIIEPFLMKVCLHSGYSLEYLVKILIWRDKKNLEFDKERWKIIFDKALETNGFLGNDSEVCWLLYAYQQLLYTISYKIAETISKNCGPLSLVAMMNGLLDRSDYKKNIDLFNIICERIRHESDHDQFWPIILELTQFNLKKHNLDDNVIIDLCKSNMLKQMCEEKIVIYDKGLSTRVFFEIESEDYDDVEYAIEDQDNLYEF